MLPLKEFEEKIASRIPKLGATKKQIDPTIICKFYETKGEDEWYVIEGEKREATYLFYGYITGKQSKMGNFTYQELENKKTVVISNLFNPCPISYIKVSNVIISPNEHTEIPSTLQKIPPEI